ncbi:MAG: M14 family zinc carboxypeptidase [Acidobacteriota bacterium]
MRFAVLIALAACHVARPQPSLVTTAEISQLARTGRYAEAVALCHDFARAYAGVACLELGRTGEGRPIVALRISRHAGLPTILVEGGIHAGEIEGKDAGFMFVRDLLAGTVAPGALDAVDVIFVPVINPDGHERFSPNNRPNQRGPAEMGFRTNGARLNLNRDFAKAETPEIAALLGVFRTYDPLVFVDIHTTDGAKFEHDISITVGPRAPRPDHLDATATGIADAVAAKLTARGHLPVEFYPSFVTDDDPLSGFAIAEAPPRFSQAYAGVRSRIGILVENHSWKTYAQRVRSSYDFLRALFELATTEAPAWRAAAERARAADLALGGSELPLVYDNGPHTTELAFRGYAFDKRPSEISGGTWIVYDETRPQIWHVPLRDELVPKVSVRVPKAGYVVDGGYAQQIAAVLDRHGIRYSRIAGEPRGELEVFRATKVSVQPLFEGHPRMQLEGAWARETRTLDRGAIFVPIAQPSARLIVHLLDPAGPDSLAQWGELATAFERKEYMESYVAEEQARAMLAADPKLRAEFDAALAADPALAASPKARLDWFYQRHPSWDERMNLLPIYRADRAY